MLKHVPHQRKSRTKLIVTRLTLVHRRVVVTCFNRCHKPQVLADEMFTKVAQIFKSFSPTGVRSCRWPTLKRIALVFHRFDDVTTAVATFAAAAVSGIAVSGQNGVSAVQGSTCIFVSVCMF